MFSDGIKLKHREKGVGISSFLTFVHVINGQVNVFNVKTECKIMQSIKHVKKNGWDASRFTFGIKMFTCRNILLDNNYKIFCSNTKLKQTILLE